ncbi:hypothetical protein [Priestia megaterium]|uniref:hypothetical protein n=1 Tax=Priestia megaterium TaxID=1404 RepID=UPI002E1A5A7D|nr:hypothetical protein [Priestia megaterium]MED4292033.1 hypothetical protein [Priestia megaterium]
MSNSTNQFLALNLIKGGHFRLSFEWLGLILLIGLGVSMFIKTKSVDIKEAGP